jgi:hypothetical protein
MKTNQKPPSKNLYHFSNLFSKSISFRFLFMKTHSKFFALVMLATFQWHQSPLFAHSTAKTSDLCFGITAESALEPMATFKVTSPINSTVANKGITLNISEVSETNSAPISAISPQVLGGTISSGNQTICYGGDPANITFSTAPPTGSTYQWFQQNGLIAAPSPTDPVTGWGLIPGATSSSYNPPAGQTSSPGITFACRVTLAGVSEWATNVRQVTILPQVNFGTLASSNQTFSETGNASIISFSTAPSGGNGTFAYRWYKAEGIVAAPTGTTIPSNWTLVSGASSSSYDPPAVFKNTSYAVMVDPTGTQNCGGFTWASGVRQITITNGCNSTFCQPAFNYGNYLYINQVNLGGVNTTIGNNNGYGFFPLTNYYTAGTTVNFTLSALNTTPLGTAQAYYRIWADFNKNGILDEFSDLVYASLPVSPLSAVSGSFTIPASAVGGRTTIRVSLTTFNTSTACWSNTNDLESGDLEDFCIYVSKGLNPGMISGSAQNLCSGVIPGSLSVTGFSPSTATFQWYFKNVIVPAPAASEGLDGGAWSLISGATSSSYTPTSSFSGSRTYACRVSANGNTLWASGVRQFTVKPTVNFGTLATGDQSFSSSSADPSIISFATPPSGGSGSFTYQWYSASITQPAPSGNAVPAGWTPISLATSNSYDPPSISTSTSYAVMVNPSGSPDCGGPTWAAGVRRITIFFPGTVLESSNPICYGGDPENITFSTPPSPGSSFQWYFQPTIVLSPGPANTDPITGWNPISGANSISYNPPAGEVLSKTYACRVSNGSNSLWATGIKQVPVAPLFNSGSISSGNQTFIGSGDPSVITFGSLPTGGIFSASPAYGYNYRWYLADGLQPAPTGTTIPSNWTLIPSATGISYDPPFQSQSTSFAVMVDPFGFIDCSNSTWAAGVRQITVTPFSPGTLTSADQTICNAGDPANITFSTAPTTGSNYIWYFQDNLVAAPANADPIGSWLPVTSSATGSNYDPSSGLTTSRTYACRVTNGASSQWATGVRKVTVLPVFNPGTVAGPDENVCITASGGNPSPITLSANPTGSGAYQWQWRYFENITAACPSSSVSTLTGWGTANAGTSGTFPTTPISFDPISVGTNGRTWAVFITPIASGNIPACGTPRFANSCKKTIRNTACRLGADGYEEEVIEEQDGASSLSQNIPNPYNETTTIPCFIHSESKSASISIYGVDGKLIQQLPINGNGNQQVTFNKGNLASGIYFYSLNVDGQQIAIKKMVISN